MRPAPPPLVTEYHLASKLCRCCGARVPGGDATAAAAAGPGSPVGVGPFALARCVLLTCAHFLPVGRRRCCWGWAGCGSRPGWSPVPAAAPPPDCRTLGETLHFGLPGDPAAAVLPLLAIADRSGQRVDLRYGDAGLAEIRHSGGYLIEVQADGDRITGLRDERVTVATDSLGNPVTYEYNELGQVVRETDPLGNVTLSGWDGADRRCRAPTRSVAPPAGPTTAPATSPR